MSEKLKPCPFCGSDDLEINGSPAMFWVTCNKCNCEGPYFTNRGEVMRSKNKAAEWWNERKGVGGE